MRRSFGYRLRLNSEEFDKLVYCSNHYKVKPSEFLRGFIDNCYESIHKNDNEMDIQDYDFEEFDEYFPR